MSIDSYAVTHADRTNLLVHLVFVPVFHAGLVAAVLGHPIAGAVMCLGSIAIQGRAHRRERVRATFDGPIDFVKRILVEQLVTFPRFVLGGRLSAMLAGNGARRDRREARRARS
jgi:hypothetical protein